MHELIGAATVPFGERLLQAVARRRSPVVVGLDPRSDRLPARLGGLLSGSWPESTAEAIRIFCCEVLDVVAPLVPAVKPQMAFFEELGPAGYGVLQQIVDYARKLGLLVILDGKRGDIGSTAEAYARAYLGPKALIPADALTVNPYLGPTTWEPFLEEGKSRGGGIFVLVKTSNPDSGTFQDLSINGLKKLYSVVAEAVHRSAERTREGYRYGCVGAVVGATYPEQLAELRKVMPSAWILIPGYGTQGGRAADVAAGFAEDGTGALVTASRSVLFAYEQLPYRERYAEHHWQRAIEQAVLDMTHDLAAHTPAGKLR